MKNISKPVYGLGDTTFQTAGGESGIEKLVNDFYDRMGSDPRFATIYNLHPDDKSLSRDKLAAFLCGWMGGPKRYHEKYGSISIPGVHRHLPIGENEREQWLDCMREALEQQAYSSDFKAYLIEELSKPAEMIRRACQKPDSKNAI